MSGIIKFLRVFFNIGDITDRSEIIRDYAYAALIIENKLTAVIPECTLNLASFRFHMSSKQIFSEQ